MLQAMWLECGASVMSGDQLGRRLERGRVPGVDGRWVATRD